MEVKIGWVLPKTLESGPRIFDVRSAGFGFADQKRLAFSSLIAPNNGVNINGVKIDIERAWAWPLKLACFAKERYLRGFL